MAAIVTLTTAKGCWCFGHALLALYKVGMGFAASKLAKKTEKVVSESLKTHANQMVERLGLKKEFKLVSYTGKSFTTFGDHLLPGEVGLFIPPHRLSENETKHIITEAICSVKFNDSLTCFLIPLVVSVATTLFFLPTLPFSAYVIGCISGEISHVALSRWTKRRILIRALEVSPPEVKQNALSLYRKVEKLLYENLSPSASLRKRIETNWYLFRFGSIQHHIRLIEASMANHKHY